MNRDTDLRMLELEPHVDSSEINRSYQKLLRRYGNNSLPSYGLFKTHERQKFLAALQESFQRLVSHEMSSLESHQELSINLTESDERLEPVQAMDEAHKREVLKSFISDSKHSQPGDSHSFSYRDLSSSDYWLAPPENLGYNAKELKEIRLGRGISLETMAKQTHVPMAKLVAIESGQLEVLTDEEELVSVLQKVAQFLRLEGQQVIEDYLSFHAQQDDEER